MATIIGVVPSDVPTEGAAAASPGAVSWGAVFAGATAAAAMSLILFILGIGLGLGSVSPWSGEGISAGAFGISTVLWITFTSLVAAAVGGYLTGRLRTRWVATHGDEVFFRDTAHGFLAWGVSTLLTAVIFATATAGLASAGIKATGAVAGTVAQTGATATGLAAVAGATNNSNSAGGANAGSGAGEQNSGPMSYYLDSLFRTNVLTPVPVNAVTAQPATVGGSGASDAKGAPTPTSRPPALTAGGEGADASATAAQNRQGGPLPVAEVTRIFARGLAKDQLPPEDVTYVGRLVSRHTGLSTQDAEARVNEIFTKTKTELNQLETSARQKADEARSASSKLALWFFVALLIGAFTGSYSATIGGRQRDL